MSVGKAAVKSLFACKCGFAFKRFKEKQMQLNSREGECKNGGTNWCPTPSLSVLLGGKKKPGSVLLFHVLRQKFLGGNIIGRIPAVGTEVL